MRHEPEPTVALAVGLVVVALLTACDPEPGRTALPIIGGRPATAGEILGTVSVDANGQVCGGTLVRPDLVVTAAHCIAPLDASLEVFARASPETITVHAGVLTWDDATDRETYAVSRAETHPDWPTFELTLPTGIGTHHDIAVLVLSRPVDTAVPVPILALEDVERDVVVGASAIIEGYGFLGPGPTEEGVLYVARSPIADRSTHEVLIGGAGEPDACSGDSGGPAYLETTADTFVIGAASRSRLDHLDCGEGGIFTLLPAYAEWIDATYAGTPVDGGTVPTSDGGPGSDGGAEPSSSGCGVADTRTPIPFPIILATTLLVFVLRRGFVRMLAT